MNEIAHFLTRLGLAAPSVLFLHAFKSLAWIGGSYALIFIAPFLPFYEERGSEIIQSLGKIENVEMLIAKIEEIEKSKRNSERA